MSKDYTCPCGQMVVKFPGSSKVQLRGGYLYGNAQAIYHCRNRECRGRKRVGYDIELLDKEGQVFHRVGIDGHGGIGGKKTARKQTRKRNPPRDEEPLSFKFLD